MYCVTNYAERNQSLWITKDCSKYELRDGFGDLSEHELYTTKLKVFERLHYEYYGYVYQFSFSLNNRQTTFVADFLEMRGSLYLVFKTLGISDYYYVVPFELLTCDLSDVDKFLNNPVIYFYIQDLFYNQLGVHLGSNELKNYLIGGTNDGKA